MGNDIDMSSEGRLTRIEDKLDQLTEVVVQLAKHDERIAGVNERLETLDRRVEAVEKHAVSMDIKIHTNKIVAAAAKWLAVCVIGALISVAARQLM